MDRNLKKLIFKTIIFILSLSIAWYLVRNGLLSDFIASVLPLKFLSGFVAGAFYASFLTSPVSLAMLVVLAKSNNPIFLALIAGFGAAFADLLIIRFFRQELSKDMDLVSHELRLKILKGFLKKWQLEFIIPLVGAVIVASPLPDELGLLMLGASKLRYHQIAILTYILNTAGILLIVAPINLLLS